MFRVVRGKNAKFGQHSQIAIHDFEKMYNQMDTIHDLICMQYEIYFACHVKMSKMQTAGLVKSASCILCILHGWHGLVGHVNTCLAGFWRLLFCLDATHCVIIIIMAIVVNGVNCNNTDFATSYHKSCFTGSKINHGSIS